jgi:hypothetical protein
MARPITWNGTAAEFAALTEAVSRACECVREPGAPTATRCAAHLMMTGDQRAVDGLLFARRIADRLRLEEWGHGPERSVAGPVPGSA